MSMRADEIRGMALQARHKFAQTDTSLLFMVIAFAGASCAILYSASQGDIRVVERQALHFALGVTLMLALSLQNTQRFIEAAPWLYVANVLALVAVLFFGDSVKGAQRWLDLGFVRFQPSELMKLTVPLMLCFIYHVLVSHDAVKHLLAGFVLILPAGLIWMQPDLGTTLLIGVSGCLLIFLAGIHWGVVVSAFIALLASAPLMWQNLHDYQQQRILTFLSPERDALGASYHTIQSKIAIGSGGLWGKGWLNGTQSQLEFVPERSTDFLFAVLAEEFGFIGAMLVIALYLLVTFRGITIALRAHTRSLRLLAGGLSLSFAVYFCANIGMVSGLLPVVGTPLPLLSYGGTSIIMFCATLGILMSLSRQERLLLGDPAKESA